MDKLEKVLEETEHLSQDFEKPAKTVGEVTQVLESGVKVVKAVGSKPSRAARRIFKRSFR